MHATDSYMLGKRESLPLLSRKSHCRPWKNTSFPTFEPSSRPPPKRTAPGRGPCLGRDVAKWANYLTFDIMAELAFGKDFGMIEGKASRELPDIIDAAVHLELIVSHRILNTPQAGF